MLPEPSRVGREFVRRRRWSSAVKLTYDPSVRGRSAMSCATVFYSYGVDIASELRRFEKAALCWKTSCSLGDVFHEITTARRRAHFLGIGYQLGSGALSPALQLSYSVLFVCVPALRVAMTGHEYSRRPGRGGVRSWGHPDAAGPNSSTASSHGDDHRRIIL